MATGPESELVRRLRSVVAAHESDSLSDAELVTRFTQARDETAFAALVRRHGPMVLGVARRLLGMRTDAEDVYQAVFLVLARKAQTLRCRSSVGNWLYGAAVRLARPARADAARRREHEAETGECGAARRGHADPAADLSLREAQMLLDAELDGLPEKYRAPLVLCCLDGQSRDEAARQLGWTAGLVKSRLEQGRDLLHRRLVRHGLTLSAPLAAGLVAEATAGQVPLHLARSAVTAAVTRGNTEAVKARVVALAGQGNNILHSTSRAAALVLIAGLSAVAFLLSASQQPPASAQSDRTAPAARGVDEDDQPTPATVSGKVGLCPKKGI